MPLEVIEVSHDKCSLCGAARTVISSSDDHRQYVKIETTTHVCIEKPRMDLAGSRRVEPPRATTVAPPRAAAGAV